MFSIAVVGCGIAGTAVASRLLSCGHRVTIFEQAAECRPVGAGILLQPSGQRALETIGVRAEVEQRSARLIGLDADLVSGRQLVRLRYGELRPDLYGLGVHRGVLFGSLFARCRQIDVQVINGAIVVGYRNRHNAVELKLGSGEHVGPFDFVVAADGSRSRLRAFSGLETSRLDYSFAALWTTGPCSSVTDRLVQIVDGTERLAGILPIGDSHCSFFWGLHVDDAATLTENADIATWKASVAAMCPQASQVLTSIDSYDSMTYATYRHASMKRMYDERVVFLGDAAHPSSPHLGQGVNLALEDAVCFSEALEESGDFAQACRRYQKERQAKVRYYQLLTRFLSPFFQSRGRVRAFGRDTVLPYLTRFGPMHRRMLRTLCGEQSGIWK